MSNIFIDIMPNLPVSRTGQFSAGTITADYLYTSDGTAALPSRSFIADTNTGIYRAGADDVGLTAGGVDRIRYATSGITILGPLAATSGVALRGTVTNDNAPTGYIGEYASSTVPLRAASGGTGVYSDMLALTLTPGDWDLTGVASLNLNGATMTEWETAITSTSGNSIAGGVEGDNYVVGLAPTAAADVNMSIPNWRRSITTTTTYYYKMAATIAAGAPKYTARISARRIR